MAIDEVRNEGSSSTAYSQSPNHTTIFVIAFVIMAALAVGEVYSIKQIDSVRDAVTASQAKQKADLEDQLSSKVAAVENSSAQALEAMKTELDNTANRMGSQGKQLAHARSLVSKLQKDQEDQANELKQEISTKADQQAVGALSEDVSATKTDLEQTKKTVNDTKTDLGMARSEFGTLIARNHDDVEQLRKMGERDYYEFTLPRNQEKTVAGVGLVLKKVNTKRHRFNMNLIADDMTIEKKDRTINEPIFFAVKDSKRFFELVVNSTSANQVKGYISTPKGSIESAANTQSGQ